jgi:hypothetical protein
VKIFTSLIWTGLFVAASQPPQPAVVTGAPYSADQMQERAGFTGSWVIGHFFRDSDGRTRTEMALKPAHWPWRIEILDPVAGVAYVLDQKNKVAYKTSIQTTAPSRNPQAIVVSLGTQNINGLLAEGTRTTFPSPSGSLILETWDSVELKANLLTTSSNGFTERLVNLKQTDPDPVLFRPPVDYTVVER